MVPFSFLMCWHLCYFPVFVVCCGVICSLFCACSPSVCRARFALADPRTSVYCSLPACFRVRSGGVKGFLLFPPLGLKFISSREDLGRFFKFLLHLGQPFLCFPPSAPPFALSRCFIYLVLFSVSFSVPRRTELRVVGGAFLRLLGGASPPS